MKDFTFTVRETVLMNNILLAPALRGDTTVKDVRVFDGVLRKLQAVIPLAPKPETPLSGKPEDKEADDKLIAEYDAKINVWMDSSISVSLTSGEETALRQKFASFKGFSLGNDDRKVVLDVAYKLGI